jgi:spermidine synthase
VVLLAALFLWNPTPIKPATGFLNGARLLAEKESTYNLIQVAEDATDHRYLLLNEGQGIHSIYTPPEAYDEAGEQLNLLTGGPWDMYLIAPYFNPPPYPRNAVKDLLVIGLAAGTTPTQFTEIYGPLPIDGVEIDPAIVEIGQRYFDMTMDNLNIHITDGRTFLRRSEQRYSVIAVDAYRLPYIPWHMTTVEFFQAIRAHLEDDGVVAINVGHTPGQRTGTGDWRLVDAMVNTMRQVYPTVHVIAVPGSFNAIVVATVQPTKPENLGANLAELHDPRLRTLTAQALDNLRDPDPSPYIFTDDHAPVEQLTHALAIRYILGLD